MRWSGIGCGIVVFGIAALSLGWPRGAEACACQAAGSSFQQSNPDGLVVMEAENFQANTPQGGHSWTLTTAFAGFSGTGAMQATPDNGGFADTPGYAATSPRLDYSVNFISTGTHYVWVLGYAPTGAGTDDSCHVGLDNTETTTSDRMTGWGTAYSWHKNTMDNVDATINITAAGLHTINVWMREDGFVIDKILLTTNAAYVPTGTGPAESIRMPAPTALMATAGYDQISLSWTAAAGATSYAIFRTTVAGGPPATPYLQVGTVNAPTVTFVDSPVLAPTKFFYVVRAIGPAGTSGNSNEVSATPLVPPVRATPNKGLQTNESGASTTFAIVFTAPAPAGGSLLTVTSSNPAEGVPSVIGLVTTPVKNAGGTVIGFSYQVAAGASPTITVTVTGIDDNVVDGPQPYQIDITATNIAVPIPSVQCTNMDNDTAGLTFSRTSGLVTTEDGGQDTFWVTLNRRPFGNVSFTLTSSNTNEGTVLPGSLTFTTTSQQAVTGGSGGWDVPHTVVVTGVDDTVLDFTQPYTIVTGTLTFTDPKDQAAFAAAGVTAAPDVSVSNIDNEVPPALPKVWGGGCGLLGPELLLVAWVLRRRRR
jgi:hypothetical protein